MMEYANVKICVSQIAFIPGSVITAHVSMTRVENSIAFRFGGYVRKPVVAGSCEGPQRTVLIKKGVRTSFYYKQVGSALSTSSRKIRITAFKNQ